MTFLDHYSTLQVFGFVLLCLFLFVMIRAHLSRRSAIDLTDLLTEYAGGKRRITMSRFSAFAGLLVGSWAFVSCAVANTLGANWEGILAYMGACFGYRVGDSWLKNQRDAQPAATDVPVDGEAPKRKGILS